MTVLANFCSLLILVPGHPEHGPFYLTKGLMKVVKEYPWPEVTVGRAQVYLNLLALFAAQKGTLPYHIAKLDSNDVFYRGDADYHAELQAVLDKLVEELLLELSKLKEASGGSAAVGVMQARLALDFFNLTAAFAELNPKSAALAANLLNMAKKAPEIKPYLLQTLNYVRSVDRPDLQEFSANLK